MTARISLNTTPLYRNLPADTTDYDDDDNEEKGKDDYYVIDCFC